MIKGSVFLQVIVVLIKIEFFESVLWQITFWPSWAILIFGFSLSITSFCALGSRLVKYLNNQPWQAVYLVGLFWLSFGIFGFMSALGLFFVSLSLYIEYKITRLIFAAIAWISIFPFVIFLMTVWMKNTLVRFLFIQFGISANAQNEESSQNQDSEDQRPERVILEPVALAIPMFLVSSFDF